MTNKTAPATSERAAHAARFRLRAAACFITALLLPLPDALALSLGRIQGSAVLGRPVQVSVPVMLQPGEELNCVRAELQQQDLLTTPLAWRLERTDGNAVLRLSSSQLVQEPVITVRVTVGCHDQFSQGYVLLADPPPQREVAPLVVAPLVATAPVPAAEPAPAPRATARPAPAPRSAPQTARAPAPQRAARPVAKAPSPPVREPAAEGRPRLQVDLLDIAIDQAPALKSSAQLAPPPPNGMSRAEAVAAWQEINSPPEKQLAAAREQSQAVQAEIQALREQTRRQSDQLQKLVDQRNLARDIIAGIAGAIAVGLALLLWRRSRETAAQRAWYQRSPVPPAPTPDDSSFVDSSFPDHAPEPQRLAPEPDSGWSGQAHVGTGGVRAAESGYGRSRMLPTAEELLDVQEKANFFLAIGQPEKAIELLETRLLEHLGGSPFLWLDLLDLCRKLQRAEDYERVREEFQRHFAARLPHFEEAHTQNGGLERYPKALSRIELLWPSTRVMQEIEKSLFEERAPGAIMFDLEASRELLLLYSIALDVTSQDDGRPYTPTMVTALEDKGPPQFENSHINTQPMPLMELDSQPESMPSAMINLGLDLDLDFSALEKTAMLPELDFESLNVDLDLDLDLATPGAARVKT